LDRWIEEREEWIGWIGRSVVRRRREIAAAGDDGDGKR
jgi:hypothetical protein